MYSSLSHLHESSPLARLHESKMESLISSCEDIFSQFGHLGTRSGESCISRDTLTYLQESYRNLSLEQQQRLQAIFFPLTYFQQVWMESYAQFKTALDAQQPLHPRVTTWLGTQRKYYYADRLSLSRVWLLDRSGFDWLSLDWEKKLRGYTQIKTKDEMFHSPLSQEAHHWYTGQLTNLEKQTPRRSAESKKYNTLQLLGLLQNAQERKTNRLNVKRIKHLYETKGPDEYKQDHSLVSWVSLVRKQHHKGNKDYTPVMKRLMKYGISNDVNYTHQQLIDFKQEHGHCIVYLEYSSSHSFSKYYTRLRRRVAKGQLRASLLSTLQDHAITLTTTSPLWYEKYKQYRNIMLEHGAHPSLRHLNKKHRQLATWKARIDASYLEHSLHADYQFALSLLAYPYPKESEKKTKSK